jgi:hypothetical protein
MKSNPHPLQERLHELFDYCEDNTSQPFMQKIRTSQRVKIGDVAGCMRKSDGYYVIRFGRIAYALHRLVWIYHNGDIPDGMLVDHVDGNKVNNRIENLRLATKSQNNHNSKIHSNNTSGIKGIFRDKSRNKWRAQLAINGKIKSVGSFDTIEEAEAAVIAARNNLHGDFARHE